MNNKHLLVQSITLLYHESGIEGATDKSSELVRTVLAAIKLPEVSLGMDHERDQIENLRKTAYGMCDDPLDHKYERTELLLRLKVDCADDQSTYEALEQGIDAPVDDSNRKLACVNLRRSLHNYFRNEQANAIIFEASNKLRFKPETVGDRRQFISEILAKLEPYQVDSEEKDPSIVGEVDFSKLDEMESAYDEVKSLEDGGLVLRTGWHALNRMLRGGFRRGEQTVIGALQHKFKTGFTLNIFRQFAMYNTPHMLDPNKKPVLVRISFEDNLANNLQFLYSSIYENAHQKPVDKEVIEASGDIARYVTDNMRINGYEIKMLRVDPSGWGYKDICNYILKLEAEGYEVHALMLDYLSMIQTKGCDEGPAGYAKRDLFRRVRNFTSPRKIALITPHQLSTEAKQLVRNGQNDFVKEIAEKGYYADCRQIDQEVDLEIYIHIEFVNGKAYLTVQRGKHRISGVTPTIDKYFVLPFLSTDWSSGILDDINGADSSLRRPGGGVVGSGEEQPFWEPGNAEAAF